MEIGLLYRIERRLSQRSQGYAYRLSWRCCLTGETAVMYVDTTYKNYRLWSEITELNQLGIYTGMRTTTRISQGMPVLDADYAVTALLAPIDPELSHELCLAIARADYCE